MMLFIYLLSTLTILAGGAVAGSAPIFSAVSVKVSLALIGLGVLPTALAHTLYSSSLSSLKSFETATLALLEPITVTLFGVFIFAEIPHLPLVLGAVFILGGIVSVAAGK